MAQTESKIKLIFEGAERGVTAAAMKAKAAIKSLGDEHSSLEKKVESADKALTKVSKGILALGAVHPAITAIGGVVGATAQLSGAAALIPGVALAGAAAFTTLGLATSGFGDAIGAVLQGDWKTFDKLVGGMAPKAAEAAKGIGSFVATLRMKVQTAFWGEFSKNLDGIGVKAKSLGQIYSPILISGLTGIASSMAHMIAVSGQAMKSPIFSGAVSSILGNTEAMFRSMSGALGSFLTGFVMMGKAGASYLPQFGNWLSKISNEFAKWASSSAGQKQIFGWISGAVTGFRDLWAIIKNVGSSIGSIFTGLGGTMASPLANLRELTASMAAFLKSAEGQEVLRNLGTVLQQVSTAVRDSLGTALRIVGPLLEGLLSYLASHPDVVAAIVPGILAATAAIKGLKIALEVKGWIEGASGALKLFGGALDGASGKIGGLVGKLGGFKGLLVAGAVAGFAVELDKINVSAAGGADKLGLFQGQLHNIVGAAGQLASGDIPGILADIQAQISATGDTWARGEAPAQQWAASIGRAATSAALSVQGFFRSLLGMAPPPPVPLNVNTAPATAGVNAWRALANGVSAIGRFLANNSSAVGAVIAWQGLGNAASAIARLLANSSAANAVVSAWRGLGNAASATARLLANSSVANAVVNAWRGFANGAVATARLFANTSAATGAINAWRSWASSIVVTVRAVLSKIGFAGGGPVVGLPGFAPGGAVHGPGSGTSDSVPAMLSAGEWVMTADQVRQAGGFAGMARIASALGGHGRVSARAALPTSSAPRGSSGGGGTVVQFAGNTSDALATVIMGMIRTGKIQIKAA